MMIVEPKVRGFICTTAHPTGCKSEVLRQIKYAKNLKLNYKPKNVLILGASTGYGIATRIVSAFACKSATLGVFFERAPQDGKTGTPGWYNSAAFENEAKANGIYAKSINGDAFSCEIKREVIKVIKEEMGGKVDLVIYSLAAPKRSADNVLWQSVLKPVGDKYSDKTVNIISGQVSNVSIDPASDEEIQGTIKVMGGEDWQYWIEDLIKADVLADNAMTIAYSYIGPEMTYPIYRHGTIGKAKEHLEQTSVVLNKMLQQHCNGKSFVSVNKGLVTQASSAIPVVPLYMSVLYKVMKKHGTHEGCIEQISRLFTDRLDKDVIPVDNENRIRIDDLELQPEVQAEIEKVWAELTTENLEQLSDIEGYRDEFYKLFGFNCSDVDYTKEVDLAVSIPSISSALVEA